MTITEMPDTIGQDWTPADWLGRVLEGPIQESEYPAFVALVGDAMAEAINQVADDLVGAIEDVEMSAVSMVDLVDFHYPRGVGFRREWHADLDPREVTEKASKFAQRVARLDALRRSLRILAGAALGVSS